MTTEQLEFWRTNLLAAIAFMQELPDEAVDLKRWDNYFGPRDERQAQHCGSVACLGGWLPYMPHFEALGVVSCASDGAPEIKHTAFDIDNVAQQLFGCDWRLFAGAHGPSHERFTDETSRTDREIAIDRLQYVLAQHAREGS